MKLALVGLPLSGKTTIFNLLVRSLPGSGELISGHDIKSHHGVVPVPDPRLNVLQEIFHSKKVSPVQVEFVDTPGFPVGGSTHSDTKGRILAEIKEADGLVHVVGAHQTAMAERTPDEAYELLADEFALIDLEIIEKRMNRLSKEVQAGKVLEAAAELQLLKNFKSALDEGVPLRRLELGRDSEIIARGFGFMTRMPELVILNVDEKTEGIDTLSGNIRRRLDGGQSDLLVVYGQLELELFELSEEDRREFLAELDIGEIGPERLLSKLFGLLGLVCFFTANEREVRAIPVVEGTTAHEAAGKVHEDIKRGFIKAEVVNFEHLKATGSWAEARKSGSLKLEGKDYRVADGDVIYFRFNV